MFAYNKQVELYLFKADFVLRILKDAEFFILVKRYIENSIVLCEIHLWFK